MLLFLRRTSAVWLCASAAACASAPAPTSEEAALRSHLLSKSIAPSDRTTRDAVAKEPPLRQAAFWAEEYEKNPADRRAATEFARASRAIGQPARAVVIANQALALHADDLALLRTLAASLIDDGRAAAAIEPLRRANQVHGQSVRTLTLLGAAYDAIKRHDEAQDQYRAALQIAPDDLAALNNSGMSYILSGDPVAAERVLRQAVSARGANAQARQNLALAMSLQSRFEEAEALAQQDVAADIARQNIAFVRTLVGTPRAASWNGAPRASQTSEWTGKQNRLPALPASRAPNPQPLELGGSEPLDADAMSVDRMDVRAAPSTPIASAPLAPVNRPASAEATLVFDAPGRLGEPAREPKLSPEPKSQHVAIEELGLRSSRLDPPSLRSN